MTVQLSPTLRAALQTQLETRRGVLAHGAAPVGWKIAASIPGVEEDAGLDGLVFGYLTTATLLPADGHFSAGTTLDLCAEVELAVRVSRHVAPDADPEAVAAAVDGVTVALEIVDVNHRGAMHEVVVGNVFHRGVAFGPTQRTPKPAPVTAWLKIDGQTLTTQTVEIDVARTVWTMTQLLAAVDQRLQAGAWIIGGSLIHHPIAPGHQLTAILGGGLGEVSLTIDP
jgi:2-keto-4-pentenoate hydratase